MKRIVPPVSCSRRVVAALLLGALAASSLPAAARGSIASASYAGLRWRFIGPLRGGRTKAIAGVADKPNRFYIGAVNGGIWRTDDAGRTWRQTFNARSTSSIGSIAVAPSDDNVIYAGSGEGLQRPDLSVGNGIYKSTNAGKTWQHLGLRHGEQIPWIAVDPRNPNRLFVAVLGHPYGPNAQRGIFRSTDGGKTFQRVLYKNENVGGYDVVIDPSNSKIVYATLWAARQAPWEMTDSYEIAGSGVYKSTDGGTTWSPLRDGFPPRLGRVELSIPASDPNRVYAAVDAPTGCGIYRSDDGGAHFSLENSDDRVCQRGDDLLAIAADPQHSSTVYVMTTSTWRSTDAGKTFVAIKGAPGGDDYQNAWINPRHSNIIALASDQGATISVDGGATWSSWYNQPTAEMYHVRADNRFPYWVCGGQQESGSACVRSRGNWGEITERDWHPVGAEEYGYVVPDPLHPGVFYGGKVERFSDRTGQTQEVGPNPLRTPPFRVLRTEPLAFGHFDKHRLYFGANQVWATTDGGMHWRTISPDLTRKTWHMPATIAAFESGDRRKGNHHGVVYALAPSHVAAGTLWAGTDDGLVWITHDHGNHWKNVTPPGLTAWSKISQIGVSRFNNRTAYVAVNRFRLDDLHPYVYRTHDGGAHWTPIVAGLPADEPVNAVRADPKIPGLLYAATEGSVFVSFDDGAHWQSLQQNLPHTSMRDIVVHGNDLIVATHGRGFWILDDVEPLRELARAKGWRTAHLFSPELTYRVRRNTNTDTPLPPEEPHGTNPPDGAILDYFLPSETSRVTLVIRDAHGNVVRRYSSDDVAPPRVLLDKPAYWERPFVKPSVSPGEHRFVWDLHEPAPPSVAVDLPIAANPHDTPRDPQGALVPPGRYTVELIAGSTHERRTLSLVMDPRVRASKQALRMQYEMAHQTAGLIANTYAEMLAAKRANLRGKTARFVQLNGRLSGLMDLIDGADAPVPAATHAAFCTLRAQALAARGALVSRNSLCP